MISVLYRSLLHAGSYPSKSIPGTSEKQSKRWRGRSHAGYRALSGMFIVDRGLIRQKDLLFHPDRWESWYALAQTYTLESENALAWAADRIDKDRKTIARYQRVFSSPS